MTCVPLTVINESFGMPESQIDHQIRIKIQYLTLTIFLFLEKQVWLDEYAADWTI